MARGASQVSQVRLRGRAGGTGGGAEPMGSAWPGAAQSARGKRRSKNSDPIEPRRQREPKGAGGVCQSLFASGRRPLCDLWFCWQRDGRPSLSPGHGRRPVSKQVSRHVPARITEQIPAPVQGQVPRQLPRPEPPRRLPLRRRLWRASWRLCRARNFPSRDGSPGALTMPTRI